MAFHNRARSSGGGVEDVNAVAASGAAQTVDLALGNVWPVTLTANCTFTLAGATAGKACTVTLLLKQDATGSRTATWPVSVKWPGSTAPTLSTGANKIDVVSLLSVDGGSTWLGFVAGLNY